MLFGRGRRPRAVLKTKGTVFLRDCFKSNFCVEFFIKEIQLKSGERARIREKSKMYFFAALLLSESIIV